jgi:eukaryotic-like serine/threonine-protein kinase
MNPVDADQIKPADPVDTDDPRLVEALEQYRAQLEAGVPPDRCAFAARFPELGEELNDCLTALEFVHGVAPDLPGVTAPALLPTVVQPEVPLGDFRIVREVGRGGMGIVYEALQLSLGRRVALKVLPFAAALDASRLQRFQHEARTAAQLHHTHIVPVHAVGCERGVHYYAMQFIEGQTLAALIRELRKLNGLRPSSDSEEGPSADRKPVQRADCRESTAGDSRLGRSLARPTSTDVESARIPEGRVTPPPAAFSTEKTGDRSAFWHSVARLGVQAARALDYAHQEGVIHRDIKPANLMIDGRGDLWIADFGLARLKGEAGLTATGDLVGTLAYMSPEQVLPRRDDFDHRCDIYSLGVTLYELLTLEPAFGSDNRAELLRQIAQDEPRPPRQIDRSLPVELETVILKAIAKNPVERYQTAQELADDLQCFLDDRPVRARRPTLVERATKWARRHRTVVGAAAVLLLLSTVGLLISTLLIAREQAATQEALNRERQQAQDAREQRARAQASFAQARRAVDFFTQISEEELADQPLLYGVRRKLLEAALVYYQNFIEQHCDDPSIQAELEFSQARVTRLLTELSTLEGSVHLQLLTDRAVQEDLKPTEAQRAQLRGLADRLKDQRRSAFREFGQLSEEDRRRRFVELARSNEQAVAELLTPEQRTRLKQIAWQQRGVAAYLDPEVAAALALTAEQQRRVRAIRAEADLALIELFDMGGPPMVARWRRHDDAVRVANEKVQEVLATEQRGKWHELIGVAFKGPERFWPGGPPDHRMSKHPLPR